MQMVTASMPRPRATTTLSAIRTTKDPAHPLQPSAREAMLAAVIADTDGTCIHSLKSPPEQHSRVEFEEFCMALAKLPSDQREALLLVSASGFTYGEAAAICETPVGTIKSRVNRARTRLSDLLVIDSADKFGPDDTTLAILTAGVSA
jgi:RNA polymerase sigma-70 factor, ECF subfamily